MSYLYKAGSHESRQNAPCNKLISPTDTEMAYYMCIIPCFRFLCFRFDSPNRIFMCFRYRDGILYVYNSMLSEVS